MATSRHESDSRVMLQPLERSSSPSSSSGSRSTWTIAQMVLSVFSSLCSHGQSPSLIRPIIESTSWRMGAKRRKRWLRVERGKGEKGKSAKSMLQAW
eukprot:6193882-Pleurochrysis_carterae.AAC.7